MAKVYLGLGSNIGERYENLAEARKRLTGLSFEILSVSPVYISEPWGFKSNNDFYNQVIEVKTDVDPYDLLDIIQETENKMGRERRIKGYSDRIIDIDILFYDNKIISSKPLIIPHPLLHKRMFVLQPMADIAPEFIHPVFNKTIEELMQECEDPPLKGVRGM
ncbi:MAG: 2-amino-4-hydroxy-6-hydroxymethyldihydropteridine diphosphokinase [Bacteroidota bacterium]